MRFAAAAALLGAACTAPHYGDGHLQCATSGRACPDGFYCASDRHCWLEGSGPPAGDLAAAADLASRDLASGDLSSRDLASGDLALIGPSLCSQLSVKLCDGFEAATIDSATWEVHTTNGAVTLDSEHVYRGAAALKLHHDAVAAGAGVNAAIRETRTFPITGTVYARAWAWLPSPVSAATAQIINMVDAGGLGVSLVIDHGHPGINDYGTPSSYAAAGSQLVPRDRWTCLQLQVQQGATTGDVHIFVDGTEVSLAQLGVATPAFTQLFFSLNYYQPPALAAEDLWLDEVIVDDQPITCAE